MTPFLQPGSGVMPGVMPGIMAGVIQAVMQAELRAMVRNRVARVASALLLALTVAASLVSFEHMRAAALERERFQSTANQHWNAQPERHPHRVVHYGHYVFRPLSPLAFFDPGVDPYTGHTLFLEGIARTAPTSAKRCNRRCYCASASSHRRLCCRYSRRC